MAHLTNHPNPIGLPFSFGVFEKYYAQHEPFSSQSGVAAIGTTGLVGIRDQFSLPRVTTLLIFFVLPGPRLLRRSIRILFPSTMAGAKKKSINLWSHIDSDRPPRRFLRYLSSTLGSNPGNTVRIWRRTTV